MGFKSKLGVGVMTGVLGLSLIGGGTYAAFNDVEEVGYDFEAGTLDLAVDEEGSFQFDISNLKPGDSFEKTLVLRNNGSLDINEIKAAVSASDHEDLDLLGLNGKLDGNPGNNSMNEFLSQFELSIDGSGAIPLNVAVNHNNPEVVLGHGDNSVAIEAGEYVTHDVKIKFVENDKTIGQSRYQEQNKFQGEGATLDFDFEATQMEGEDRSNDGQ